MNDSSSASPPVDVDRHAPLVAEQDIVINASIERVWTLQSDIGRWPEWQPDVVSAELQGPLRAGTVFRWKAAGLNITSTLQVVEPQKRIGWSGVSLGMKAVHHWYFEDRAGTTWVKTEESLSGWFARLLKLFDRRFLEKSLAKSLRTLKEKAENIG